MERKLLTTDTEIHCMANITEFNGGAAKVPQFVRVQSYSADNDLYSGTDMNGQGHYTTTSAQITAIEGMDPERFAKVYNINPDGTSKAPGKKRGRKPKKV